MKTENRRHSLSLYVFLCVCMSVRYSRGKNVNKSKQCENISYTTQGSHCQSVARQAALPSLIPFFLSLPLCSDPWPPGASLLQAGSS